MAFNNDLQGTLSFKARGKRQASELDLDMAQTLRFKIIMIKVLMKKVDNMQEQVGNVSKEKH